MEPLKSNIVEALVKRPLVAGVPKWIFAGELGILACVAFGMGIVHILTLALGGTMIVVHSFVATKCRKDPWAVEIFFEYLMEPVVYDGVPRFGAPRAKLIGTLPNV